MARGQTLETILNKTRAKARVSLSPAANTQVRESHIILLQTEQDRLWEDYAWPHLRKHFLIPLQAGQFLYDLPAENFDATAGTYTLLMDRVEHISVMDGGRWKPLIPEITEDNYSSHQTALDQRSWPVSNWQATDGDQIEVWPLPDTNGNATTLEGYLRVTGIRSLRPFVAESDRADIDDELISGFVSAGMLAEKGAKDAELKLQAVAKLYTKLKGKQTKTASFNLFGTTSRNPTRRKPAITRYVA